MCKKLEKRSCTILNKILIITDTYPPEKVGSYRMHDLAVNLSKNGYIVTVICPPPTFPFGAFKRSFRIAEVEYSKGIKIVHLWTWQPTSASASIFSRLAYYSIMPVFASAWVILNGNFDVIITSSGTSPLIWLTGLLQKYIHKKPWLIDERDLLIDGAIQLGFLNKTGLLTLFARKFHSLCYHKCDYIVEVTESAKRAILTFNIVEKKVLNIPNAAETEIFRPIPLDKKRQIIYAGNIGYAQDFEVVIGAMKKLASYRITLLMVGEGEVKQSLQKKVLDEGLENNVKFLNGVDRTELPYLLSESMVGLAPLKNLKTIESSIPGKIFDYMACGIPFIAFGGLEIKQLANDSGAGVVVDNDVYALTNAVLRLVDSPELAKEMGRKGREYCVTQFNRKFMANQMISVIHQSLGGSKKLV